MNEFALIENFFANKTQQRKDVALGIGDDCALVEIPSQHQLAITTDTLVADVHFFKNAMAFDVGYKSLAVNLSDLAAMGAEPTWFTLALTLPDANEKWLDEFCQGLFSCANKYQVQLIGGDLTRGPLSITIEAFGFVPQNEAIRRDQAKTGDFIYVTNTLGDAAFGLHILQNKLSPIHENYFLKKLYRPEPCIAYGEKLRKIAHAAIDISDGLAGDLEHILGKSHKGAIIFVDKLPLSDELRSSLSENEAIELALHGGDDYELCFTAEANVKIPFDCTCIGKITDNLGLDLQFTSGEKYNSTIKGYKHF
jgi:thiamine-monophosphate kinase